MLRLSRKYLGTPGNATTLQTVHLTPYGSRAGKLQYKLTTNVVSLLGLGETDPLATPLCYSRETYLRFEAGSVWNPIILSGN